MTANAVVHRGSCLCGGVRYETTAPLQAASHCHCSMCRKAHGAAFGSYARVRREHHRLVQGQALVRTYRSSAYVTRQFCSVCGSPLLWHSEAAHADWVAMPLGTLDTPYDTPPPTTHPCRRQGALGGDWRWLSPADRRPGACRTWTSSTGNRPQQISHSEVATSAHARGRR